MNQSLPPGSPPQPTIMIDGVEFTAGQIQWMRRELLEARQEIQQKARDLENALAKAAICEADASYSRRRIMAILAHVRRRFASA